jgi:signal transduction histidine kinase
LKHIKLYVFLFFTSGFLLDTIYRSLDYVARNQPSHWAPILIQQATGYYLAMALLPWVFFMARRFPPGWSAAFFAVQLGGAVCYAVVHTSLMWGTRAVLFPLLGLGAYDYGVMPTRYVMEFPGQLLHWAMWVGAYTVYHNWLRTKDLETQLVQARLSALTHQLQPHFLFNALNAVSAAIYEDRDRADRMLERIADFLRATLKLPDSPTVPLATELALARQYLEVMKARLEDRLRFEIQREAGAESAQVPALLLQPLVENAIEHGQDPESGRLDVTVHARRAEGFLRISVCDRGRGWAANGANGSGRGLANARERLRTVYGDRASLEMGRNASGGASVEIKIAVPS